ncbi:hypothetical protein [Hymenobacter cellulosivorans]|uniref:Uncharacterized protein n=1 Tax=Hymenobacter cellulosivorans TaxID=2932249 RepID=A0ABY4FDZ8_9BACT|nr:hypothetical protein [Hymenobacter cellulosivorans]UOQ54910.1 hypothetical protein MUN80_09155 [Hymenobacter cellulosivorans]
MCYSQAKKPEFIRLEYIGGLEDKPIFPVVISRSALERNSHEFAYVVNQISFEELGCYMKVVNQVGASQRGVDASYEVSYDLGNEKGIFLVDTSFTIRFLNTVKGIVLRTDSSNDLIEEIQGYINRLK